jgi:hypothetical protein
MIVNTSKAEQPLIGKGLLYSQEEKDLLLTESNKIETIPLGEDNNIRKSWHYEEVFDQGKTCLNTSCTWAAYLSTMCPVEEMGMSYKDFIRGLYYESQLEDPWAGTDEVRKYGTSLLSAGTVLKNKGFFNQLLWTDDVDKMSNHILTRGAIMVASEWTTEMGRIDPNGFSRPYGAYEGNHCWLVYGVDDMWETFFCLNSWGKEFGKDGKFLIKFTDMKKILQDGYAITTAQ